MANEKIKEDKTVEQKDTHPVVTAATGRQSLLVPLIVIAAILVVGWTAFAVGRHADDRFGTERGFRAGGMMRAGDEDDMGMRGDAGMGRGMYSTNFTSSTRVSGVVTAVEGDTITVSGNGITTKVMVNNNTNYVGDDKPAKVNDTIMAFGARDSDNTLVASAVRLSRQ